MTNVLSCPSNDDIFGVYSADPSTHPERAGTRISDEARTITGAIPSARMEPRNPRRLITVCPNL